MKDFDVYYKHHEGVQCDDLSLFFANSKNQPLQTYLITMEDDTHGLVHFTFGGVGGDHAYATTTILQATYGFAAADVIALEVSAQAFFKEYLAQDVADYNEFTGLAFPLNCTADPWQDNELASHYLPGEPNGPSCDFIDSYYESDDALNEIIDLFFPELYTDTTTLKVKSLEFDDKSAVLKLIANLFPYYGEMASSSAGKQAPKSARRFCAFSSDFF
jgi:hypothetical protein